MENPKFTQDMLTPVDMMIQAVLDGAKWESSKDTTSELQARAFARVRNGGQSQKHSLSAGMLTTADLMVQASLDGTKWESSADYTPELQTRALARVRNGGQSQKHSLTGDMLTTADLMVQATLDGVKWESIEDSSATVRGKALARINHQEGTTQRGISSSKPTQSTPTKNLRSLNKEAPMIRKALKAGFFGRTVGSFNLSDIAKKVSVLLEKKGRVRLEDIRRR